MLLSLYQLLYVPLYCTKNNLSLCISLSIVSQRTLFVNEQKFMLKSSENISHGNLFPCRVTLNWWTCLSLDHLVLIDLVITMLTELSAVASGITGSGRGKEAMKAGPLIMHGHTISIVFLWKLASLKRLQTSSFHKLMYTCPLVFSSSRMTNMNTNSLHRHSEAVHIFQMQRSNFFLHVSPLLFTAKQYDGLLEEERIYKKWTERKKALNMIRRALTTEWLFCQTVKHNYLHPVVTNSFECDHHQWFKTILSNKWISDLLWCKSEVPHTLSACIINHLGKNIFRGPGFWLIF